MASILGMDSTISGVLLQQFHWNKEKLLEKYTEDPSGILESVGLSMLTHPGARIEKVAGFFCQICCNEGDMDTFAINCGHRYCALCYRRFISQRINEEGDCRNLRCPGDCREILDDKSINALLSENTFKK